MPNVGMASFVVWVAYFLIFKLALTLLATKFPDNPFTKALGALS